MIGLIKAEFYKQRVTGIFYLYIILMALVGVGTAFINLNLQGEYSLVQESINFLSNSIVIYMIIATLAAFYKVKDFNDKSIQHCITSGYSRKEIILCKSIVFNGISIFSFIIYFVLGLLTSVLINDFNFTSECVKVLGNIVILLLFKIIFIVAFNGLCMLFCYIVKNYASYFLVIISLWLSFIGPAYYSSFVVEHSILQSILKYTVIVQDYLIINNAQSNAVAELSFSVAATYILVVLITRFITYMLNCFVLEKTEIK